MTTIGILTIALEIIGFIIFCGLTINSDTKKDRVIYLFLASITLATLVLNIVTFTIILPISLII